MRYLSSRPKLSTCSADTILCAIKELTVSNITYTSPVSGKSYDFNISDKMNELLLKSLISTGELRKGQRYDWDFDHQFTVIEKYDAKPTYKKFTGYSPGIAVIGNHIVGIENRDGNANVRFHQQDTLVRNFYKTIIKRMNVKDFGLSTTSRIKTFVFKFISVPAKWIKTSREYRLNIYTVNPAYARVFNASD